MTSKAVAETALICRVPEAEPLISRYRDRYDPSARRNVPAHVTVLYPFMPPTDVDEAVHLELAAIARSVPCFDYRMTRTQRFPVALYLEPEPDRYFAALTNAVHRAFPDYPPFAGKFATVVPHVTVAHGDEPLLAEIDVELRIALASAGGIRGRCQDVVLIENSSGRWETLREFALGVA